MKKSRPVSLTEWYDETAGHHTHCHAERPETFPGIVCASEEERDQLLKAQAECERLRGELSEALEDRDDWATAATNAVSRAANTEDEAGILRTALDQAEKELTQARAALKECREALILHASGLHDVDARPIVKMADAALAADTPREPAYKCQACLQMVAQGVGHDKDCLFDGTPQEGTGEPGGED